MSNRFFAKLRFFVKNETHLKSNALKTHVQSWGGGKKRRFLPPPPPGFFREAFFFELRSWKIFWVFFGKLVVHKKILKLPTSFAYEIFEVKKWKYPNFGQIWSIFDQILTMGFESKFCFSNKCWNQEKVFEITKYTRKESKKLQRCTLSAEIDFLTPKHALKH